MTLRATVSCVLLTFVGLVPGAARAEVKQSAADGFLVQHELVVAASPAAVWAALPQVGKWWNPAHSWSKAASNLSLEPRAGGCFCETWSSSSVEHGRVVMVREGQLLRLHAALGPLQELALFGALTWSLAPEGPGTKLTVTYRVSGDSLHALEKLAPAVDGVIGEQAARLKRFAETGW